VHSKNVYKLLLQKKTHTTKQTQLDVNKLAEIGLFLGTFHPYFFKKNQTLENKKSNRDDLLFYKGQNEFFIKDNPQPLFTAFYNALL
jgi:hypothetical protein